MSYTIDLNLDAGEMPERLEDGSEARLYDLVTSVNIACGGHAGDEATMRAAVRLAKERNLAIGAHPSYPDRENFGRVKVPMGFEELKKSLLDQIKTLKGICDEEKAQLVYVKPHGALYNVAAFDEEAARAVIDATTEISSQLAIMGLSGSPFANWCAQSAIRFISEAFIDRRYESDGRLRDRSQPDALISDSLEMGRQALSLIKSGKVQAVSGETIEVRAETLCIHGDSPHAFANLLALRKALSGAGVRIRRFDL